MCIGAQSVTDTTITKPPNPWGSTKGQQYRESFRSPVEIEAKIHQNELRLKPQFGGIEELLFRAELETLLNEYKARYVTQAIDYSYGAKARYVGEFVKQDRDYILGELQKRLASLGMYPDNDQLTLYLKNISKVIAGKLARGEDISAIPFTGKSYAKRGRPPKPRKRNHKTPVFHNGKPYESIAAAAKEDSERSYAALRQKLWRDAEKNANEQAKQGGIHIEGAVELVAVLLKAAVEGKI